MPRATDCVPSSELYSVKILAPSAAASQSRTTTSLQASCGDVPVSQSPKVEDLPSLIRPCLHKVGSHECIRCHSHKARRTQVSRRRPIADAEVRLILNAGRRAQSSKNEQAWHFIAIRDKTILKALSECGKWAGHIAGAALGVAILTPDPVAKFQTMFDAGQAAAYMQLAAWDLGIGSCPASIYDVDAARAILGFPSNLYLRIALSFGYPADETKLSAPPKQGGRQPLEDMVHYDKW